jgi:hypothetical protein
MKQPLNEQFRRMQKLAGIIVESKYNDLEEEADPSQIEKDLYPTKLSQVNPEKAKKLANNPAPGPEDKAKGGNISAPANSLKASQTTMDFGKFVGMAIQMLGKIGSFSTGAGGDLGAIISSDNHIMDGHHRWAATLMVDPKSKVGGIKINLPGEKLVGVLNVWTVAKGQKGKPSDTNLAELTGDAVAEKFKEMVNKGGGFLPSSEEILEKFKVNGFNSLDAAADFVKKNWDSTAGTRKIEPWMPAKIDMPAIEPDQLQQVKKDIESGKLDLNPPYKSGVKENMNESFIRIQKLAGLITESQYKVKLNEVDDEDFEDEDEFDLNAEFKASPNEALYREVLKVFKEYEDDGIIEDFKAEFPKGEPVSKDDYFEFAMTLIDDMSEVAFIQANWISIFDEDIYEKAGLM